MLAFLSAGERNGAQKYSRSCSAVPGSLALNWHFGRVLVCIFSQAAGLQRLFRWGTVNLNVLYSSHLRLSHIPRLLPLVFLLHSQKEESRRGPECALFPSQHRTDGLLFFAAFPPYFSCCLWFKPGHYWMVLKSWMIIYSQAHYRQWRFILQSHTRSQTAGQAAFLTVLYMKMEDNNKLQKQQR